MTSKILISTDVCKDDVVRYLALRYRCEPADIVRLFLEQDGVVKDSHNGDSPRIQLEENEMAILRDMDIEPSEIDFV